MEQNKGDKVSGKNMEPLQDKAKMLKLLRDKLQSMGVELGSEFKPRRKNFAIEDVVPVVSLPTPHGEALLLEQDYPATHRQGDVTLAPSWDLGILLEWAEAGHGQNMAVSDLLLLDTETTGLAGGTGTLVFLIGLGYWRPSGFHLVQLFLREPMYEPGMLAKLTELLPSFRGIVSFNGKAFDVPLLTARHILNGLPPSLAGLFHLDLLPLARRLWKNRLASRALRDLERDILHFTRTKADIPGWLIPQMYLNYLKTGDARPLAGVFYHNAMDIVSLAALLAHVAARLNAPLQANNPQSLDVVAIAHLYEDLERTAQAIELYQYSLTTGIPQPFLNQTRLRLAAIYKRGKNWPSAVKLWEEAAHLGDIPACVELAKFYEHEERDYRTALHWTNCAQEQLARPGLREQWNELLEHRAARLQRLII